MKEGYGFQPVHVERARELGCRLIVTADCGATAHDAAAAALAAGFELIITDHHLPGGPLPTGATLVNPRQELCDYPFPDLAGVGLALKLGLALAQRTGRKLELEALLRVACLGTIADLVPLTGENRVIAALGLAALARTRSPGLLALIREVRPAASRDVLRRRLPARAAAQRRRPSGERRVGARVAPLPRRRPGGGACRASSTSAIASVRPRRRECSRRRGPGVAALPELPPIVVEWASDWHRGVVGIAAGRLARELARPVVLLAVSGETATGSGRSVPGVHLHEFLSRWQSRYERFGGHAQAIGLTVVLSELEELRGEWARAGTEFADAIGRWRFEYELELAPHEVDRRTLAELERLEPHGQGNPQPLVRVDGLRLDGQPRAFGRDHLSARARGGDDARVRLLGWGWGSRQAELAERFDVLAYLERDRWDGEAALRLLDVRPSAADSNTAGIE